MKRVLPFVLGFVALRVVRLSRPPGIGMAQRSRRL